MQRVKRFPVIDGDLGWLETSPSQYQEIGRRLKGEQVFDIVIVGAGFTGLSLAHRLAEINPSINIAIIDALKIGQGTSGRNAGFIIDLPHNLDAGKSNLEHNQQLYQLNQFSIQRLRTFTERHNIDCAWHDAGKYMAVHESSNYKGLEEFMQTLKALNLEFELFSGQELTRRLGTEYYQAAVYTPGNILMNPSSLVRGLAKALPKSVTVFEQSPVLSYEYGETHKLQCLGGLIRAKVLVQTANAYTEEFGLVSNRLVPVFTYASLTEQLSEIEIQKHFKDIQPWGLTSAHPAGTTVRLTPDRRIFVRNVLDFEPSLHSTQELMHRAWQQHQLSFNARFPSLSGKNFEFTWGGMLCMTLNQQSLFEQPTHNVYIVGGCNGVGVAKGTYLGYYMADFINGINSDSLKFIQANSSPSWIPPDPLRTLGARLRLRQEQSTAGGDI